eukprot:11472707-Alexandrium_andersonii.AAC.1
MCVGSRLPTGAAPMGAWQAKPSQKPLPRGLRPCSNRAWGLGLACRAPHEGGACQEAAPDANWVKALRASE